MKRGIIYLILNKQNGYKYIANTTLTMNKEWIYHIDKSKRIEPLMIESQQLAHKKILQNQLNSKHTGSYRDRWIN